MKTHLQFIFCNTTSYLRRYLSDEVLCSVIENEHFIVEKREYLYRNTRDDNKYVNKSGKEIKHLDMFFSFSLSFDRGQRNSYSFSFSYPIFWKIWFPVLPLFSS